MRFSIAARSCFSFVLAMIVAAQAQDWHVGTSATLSQSYVILHPASDSVGKIDFHPNNGGQPGFEVRYKQFGLSMTPALSGTSRFRSHRPPTKFSDYKLFHYGNRWGVDGYYQYFRGYYGEYGDGAEVNFPSMTLNTLLFNLYRSMYSRRYPQLRDFPDPKFGSRPGGGIEDLVGDIDGSGFHFNVYGMLSAFRHGLESDRPFLDSASAPRSAFGGMTRLSALGASAGIGVNGGTVWRGIFASHSLYAGAGWQRNGSNVATADGFAPHAKIGGKSYAGYRMGRFKAGVLVHGDVTVVTVSEETASYSLGLVKLFAEVSI